MVTPFHCHAVKQPWFWVEGYFVSPQTVEPTAIVWTHKKCDFREKLDISKYLIWPDLAWEEFDCDSHGGPYSMRAYVRFHPDVRSDDIARAFDSLLYRTSIFDKIRSLF